MLEDSGFADVVIGPAADIFGGTAGEEWLLRLRDSPVRR
jgi:hypothetical protein